MNSSPFLHEADHFPARKGSRATPLNQRFLRYFVDRYANRPHVGMRTELIAAVTGLGAASICLQLRAWWHASAGLPSLGELMLGAAVGVVAYVLARRALAVPSKQEAAVHQLASALLDANRECLKLIGVDGRLLHVSEYGAALMGAPSSDAMVGANWLGFWEGEHKVVAHAAFAEALKGNRAAFSASCPTFKGEVRWWQSRLIPVKDRHGRVVSVLCPSLDTTTEAQLLERLKAKETLMSEMEAHIAVAFYSYSADFSYFYYVSAGAEQLFGIPLETFHREPNAWLGAVLREDLDGLRAEMQRIASERTAGRAQYRIRKPDGAVRWLRSTGYPVRDSEGTVTRIVGVSEDVTDECDRLAELDRLAYTDSLTGLPNRVALLREIQTRIDAGLPFSLMFVDLDRFKVLNDTLGHMAADRLLTDIGRAIRVALPADAYVARLGGDEFAILVRCAAKRSELEEIAQALLDQLARTGRDERTGALLSASIGISLYPDHGTDQETLLTSADVAMYAAKRSGRNGFRFAGHEATEKLGEFELERDLPDALASRQFLLQYQTIHDPQSMSVHGAEALLRWQHPLRGIISPGVFIPILEETGFIVDVGAWVLDQALSELAGWRRRGATGLALSVNISARQLSGPSIVETVDAALRRYGIPPGKLELELTETGLMENPAGALRTILALKALGVRIAIDDFGTGYSSLRYLADFSPDTLKIDRSFTSKVVGDAATRTIVEGVVRLACELGIRVVAEGVEQREQLDVLREVRCDYVQGYLLSRPESSEDFARRLFAAA